MPFFHGMLFFHGLSAAGILPCTGREAARLLPASAKGRQALPQKPGLFLLLALDSSKLLRCLAQQGKNLGKLLFHPAPVLLQPLPAGDVRPDSFPPFRQAVQIGPRLGQTSGHCRLQGLSGSRR